MGRGPLRVVLLLGSERDVGESGGGTNGAALGLVGVASVDLAAGAASGAGGVSSVRCRRLRRGAAGLRLSELASGFGGTFRLATLASTHGLRGHAGSLQVAGFMGEPPLPVTRR